MTIRSVFRWLALLATLVSVTAPAAAQTCFQPVGGVPGAYSQPPDWWSTGATPLGSVTGSFDDDPRWQGATSFSHISDNGRFRVLVETTGGKRFFVASWHVKADPTGPKDRLYLGFWDETSNQGNVFRLEKGDTFTTPTPVPGGVDYAGAGFTGRFFNRTSATGNTWALNNAGGAIVPPLPTWLKKDTRIDVAGSEWTIRMRIPIDAAADVTSDDPTGVKITTGNAFRFFYEIQSESGVGTSVLYGWPEGLSPAQEGGTCGSIPAYCFPDPLDTTSSWLKLKDGISCTGDISITADQIYANSVGSITVKLTSTNHFHATPTNNTTSDQAGSAIKATFRLANWGSALFDSPAWNKICSDTPGTAGTIMPTHPFDVNCDYDVPDPCAFKPATDTCGPTHGTKNIDQCVLVDLASGSGGGPFHFSPQSAWQNMLFNGASVVRKVAELDARGLPPLPAPAPNRDLYVYVGTSNMPAERSPKAPPIDLEKFSGNAREKLAKLKISLPQAGGLGKSTADAIAAAMGAGQLSAGEVAALMPTYTASVWYDTGRTMSGSAGTPLKLLAPQPSFGLFLWHDGDLYGWRHLFEGSTITELSPNFYRVSVPTNGTVKIDVTVTACEQPGCSDAPPPKDQHPPPPTPTPMPPWWKMWLWVFIFIGVAVALLLFFLYRKK